MLVLGKSDKLALVGVLGEFNDIWLNEVAVLLLLVGSVNLGRSAGGRGAGPGFMNWSGVYMLLRR